MADRGGIEAFCQHCATHHPIDEMRQMLSRSGKRWRCVKSIEATKAGISKRDAFGRQITAINKAEARAKLGGRAHPERDSHS